MDEKRKHPHGGHRARMREKLLAVGLDGLQDHEIIEFLLFYAVPRRDTNQMAHHVMEAFGSLRGLLEATPHDLMARAGLNEQAALLIGNLLPICRRYMAASKKARPLLDTSGKAGAFAASLFVGETDECFYIICLDSRHRLIRAQPLTRGTATESFVYTRQVVDTALKYNCAAVILSHNHPSGLLAASPEDISSTRAITAALAHVDISVLDHIIVAGDGYLSFAAKKMLGMGYD